MMTAHAMHAIERTRTIINSSVRPSTAVPTTMNVNIAISMRPTIKTATMLSFCEADPLIHQFLNPSVFFDNIDLFRATIFKWASNSGVLLIFFYFKCSRHSTSYISIVNVVAGMLIVVDELCRPVDSRRGMCPTPRPKSVRDENTEPDQDMEHGKRGKKNRHNYKAQHDYFWASIHQWLEPLWEELQCEFTAFLTRCSCL